ncbi:hypothetical protein Tco_0104888 [Tanacetum coccineum]
MLERLAGTNNTVSSMASRVFQIPIDQKIKKKTTFTCQYGTLLMSAFAFWAMQCPWLLVPKMYDGNLPRYELKNDGSIPWMVFRLENPHQDKLENKEINEAFPLETLGSIALQDQSTPWFADFANYHAGKFVIRTLVLGKKLLDIVKACTVEVLGNTIGANLLSKKISFDSGFYCPTFTKDAPLTLSPYSRIVKALDSVIFNSSFTSSASIWEFRRNGYKKKDEKQSQNDKMDSEWKSLYKDKAKSKPKTRIVKVKVKLKKLTVKTGADNSKYTVGCNLNPSDGRERPNSVY